LGGPFINDLLFKSQATLL